MTSGGCNLGKAAAVERVWGIALPLWPRGCGGGKAGSRKMLYGGIIVDINVYWQGGICRNPESSDIGPAKSRFPEGMTERKARAKAEARTNARAKAEARTNARAKAEARTNARAKAEARTNARTKAEARTNARTKAEARTNARTKAEARTNARTKAEARTNARTKAKAKATAVPSLRSR